MYVLYIYIYIIYAVVCTDLTDKEPHIRVDVGKVVTSGSLGESSVSTLAWNASNVGSIPALGAIFPLFITSISLVAVIRILCQLHAVYLLGDCWMTIRRPKYPTECRTGQRPLGNWLATTQQTLATAWLPVSDPSATIRTQVSDRSQVLKMVFCHKEVFHAAAATILRSKWSLITGVPCGCPFLFFASNRKHHAPGV